MTMMVIALAVMHPVWSALVGIIHRVLIFFFCLCPKLNPVQEGKDCSFCAVHQLDVHLSEGSPCCACEVRLFIF